MTREQIRDVEQSLLNIINDEDTAVDYKLDAVHELTEFVSTFEREIYHQPEDEKKYAGKDIPAPGGCVISQYCNNELIHKLIKELKTGELVNPLAKASDVVRALQNGIMHACSGLAKDPILLEAAIVEGHYVALICGGNNGNGKWESYLDQLTSITCSLEEQGYSAWLIRLDNDCPDDVWYAYIGFREEK